MKNMKKIGAIALAMVLALALCAPAFAAGNPGDITIADPIPGKTYTVYKVFDLVYEGDNYSYTLPSDSPWMSTIEEFFTVTPQAADSTVSNAVVKDGFSAAAFAEKLSKAENKPDTVATWTAPEKETPDSHTIETGELGYYFVTSDAGSLCMLDNTNPTATIHDKNDKPTIDKTVDDEDKTVYVGQKLTYTITGKVPSTTGYTKYDYIVTDTMSGGLSFNEDVSVTIGGTKIDVTPDYTPENGFKVTIPVMEHQDQVGDEIAITYTATVNENAVSKIEENKAQLEYSNDPADTTSTGKTIEKIVKVYDATIEIDKYKGDVDENGNLQDPTESSIRLSGAKFVLINTETVSSETKYYKWVDAVLADNPDTTDIDETIAHVEWVSSKDDATEVETENGKAEFKGLDNGIYYLLETKAPDGYNLADKTTKVEINIDKDDDTISETTLTLKSQVANLTGGLLPSTGGIGTTIFYIVGGILVVGAVILLVTRKRVSDEV